MPFLITPLDDALSSKSKIRLLRLLIEQDRTVSAREAARLTGRSLTAMLAAIDDLARLGLIQREESGRQFLCRANHDNKLVQLMLEPLFRAEVAWPELVVSAMRQALTGVVAAWMYGSVARGSDEPGSDLDLFVVTAKDKEVDRVSERLIDAVPKWRDEFGVDVRPIVMSRRMSILQRDKPGSLIRNAVRDARVILGEIPKELRLGQTDHDA